MRIRAARVLAGERLLDGATVVVADGFVQAVLESRGTAGAVSEAGGAFLDLGDVLLAPAFVDAHAHLELSGLAGRIPSAETFTAWIRALVAARARSTPADLERDARAGARRLLATGTALVGDIDSSGAIESGSEGLALRVRRYREALDAGDEGRARAVRERAGRAALARDRFHEGLSPHAPYSVSRRLGRGLAELARARDWPVAIHFAETREELEWLEYATGPLSAILAHSPRARGLDLVEEAGLLGARTLLVHGNHADASERARIAHGGATLVHCPGTHRFFGREPFDARAWLDAGVPLALGTDSLASNEDLDMGRELALFAAAQPSVAPREAWACATRHGARALGFEGLAGVIAPGAWADFALYTGVRKGGDPLEALVHQDLGFAGLWVGGAPVGPGGRGVIQDPAPGSEATGRGPQ